VDLFPLESHCIRCDQKTIHTKIKIEIRLRVTSMSFQKELRNGELCKHTYRINDSIIRIFSGLSTRFDCKDAFESQINVGPNIIAKFLASIYFKKKHQLIDKFSDFEPY
jgi:hypothetical protein